MGLFLLLFPLSKVRRTQGIQVISHPQGRERPHLQQLPGANHFCQYQHQLLLKEKKNSWHLLKMPRQSLFRTIVVDIGTTTMGFYSVRERDRGNLWIQHGQVGTYSEEKGLVDGKLLTGKNIGYISLTGFFAEDRPEWSDIIWGLVEDEVPSQISSMIRCQGF